MKKLLLFLLVASSISFAQFTTQAQFRGEKTTKFTEDVLLDQSLLGTEVGYGAANQRFPDFGDAMLQSADDFTVPGDVSWIITSVSAQGFFNVAASTLLGVDVIFYADNGGIPGDEVYSALNLTPTDPASEDIFVTLTDAATLAPGTYWVSIVGVMNYNPGGHQYYNLRRNSANGSGYVNRDPDGLTGTVSDWGTPDYSAAPNDLDLAFVLNGMTGTVPVELTSFTAVQKGSAVELNWSTATETNNKGFEIERSVVTSGTESTWKTVGYVDGKGTTTEAVSYRFSDNLNGVDAEAVEYRLKQIDYDGAYEYSDVVSVENIVPTEYSVSQNYPNPFNPSTKITFALPTEANVSLRVYNALGQEVSKVVNGTLNAGTHVYTFNASEFTSGIYFYSFDAQGVDGTNYNMIRKMMLVK